MGIKTLNKKFHKPIYAIYGFVRFADEIVDSFYGQNQKNLLQEFKKETYNSIRRKMSLNPILNSFQICVNKYKIPEELIDSFLYSMEMDLNKKKYDKSNYEKYIYGTNSYSTISKLFLTHIYKNYIVIIFFNKRMY